MFESLFGDPTPAAQQHIRGGALHGRTIGTVTTPIRVPQRRPPHTSWSFFHPGRPDARFAPEYFRREVHAIDSQLDVVWHATKERWTVWVRNPRIQHWMCAGWQLLFPVQYPDGRYMPLDERTLACIYDRSPRKWGNGRIYFDRILDEIERDHQRGKAEREDIVTQIARDHYKHAQIQVGYGATNGSKFADHQSGG